MSLDCITREWDGEGLPDPAELVNQFLLLPLPGGFRCGVMAHPSWQREAKYGDELQAVALLALPATVPTLMVHPDLVFGERLKLFGEHTNEAWGMAFITYPADLPVGGRVKYRHARQVKFGKTWADAVAVAADYALAEYVKLLETLEARHAALASEGRHLVDQWEMVKHACAK